MQQLRKTSLASSDIQESPTIRSDSGASPDLSPEAIAVDQVDGQHRVVARKDFAAGEHILRLMGDIVAQPSKYSVQIGPIEHLEVPAEAQMSQPMDRYRWRFLNHSCDPNAEFEGMDLVAIREIRAGEQITFDYHTTEYDMSTPFECVCGAENCRGVVRGYRWREGASLQEDQRPQNSDSPFTSRASSGG